MPNPSSASSSRQAPTVTDGCLFLTLHQQRPSTGEWSSRAFPDGQHQWHSRLRVLQTMLVSAGDTTDDAIAPLLCRMLDTGAVLPLRINPLRAAMRVFIVVGCCPWPIRFNAQQVVGDDFALEVMQQRHLQRNQVTRCVSKTAVINH